MYGAEAFSGLLGTGHSRCEPGRTDSCTHWLLLTRTGVTNDALAFSILTLPYPAFCIRALKNGGFPFYTVLIIVRITLSAFSDG